MLKNFSQVFIRCSQCETPHVYVFVLPTSEVQKNESLNLKASSVFSHAQNLGETYLSLSFSILTHTCLPSKHATFLYS